MTSLLSLHNCCTVWPAVQRSPKRVRWTSANTEYAISVTDATSCSDKETAQGTHLPLCEHHQGRYLAEINYRCETIMYVWLCGSFHLHDSLLKCNKLPSVNRLAASQGISMRHKDREKIKLTQIPHFHKDSTECLAVPESGAPLSSHLEGAL